MGCCQSEQSAAATPGAAAPAGPPAAAAHGAAGGEEPGKPSVRAELAGAAADAAQAEAADLALTVKSEIPTAMVMVVRDPVAAKNTIMAVVGDLTRGIDFSKISMAVPLEWAARVFANAAFSVFMNRFQGTEIGDTVAGLLTPELENVYNGLRTILDAKYEKVIAKHEKFMMGILNSGFLKTGSLAEDAREDYAKDINIVSDGADAAFHYLKDDPNKQLDIVNIACTAATWKIALARQPSQDLKRKVASELAWWIGKMLDIPLVTNDVAYRYGGTWNGQYKTKAAMEARTLRLRKVAGTIIHAERFAAAVGVESALLQLDEKKRLNCPKLVDDEELFPPSEARGGLTEGDENFVLQALCGPEKLLWNSKDRVKRIMQVMPGFGTQQRFLTDVVAVFPGRQRFLTNRAEGIATVWDANSGNEICNTDRTFSAREFAGVAVIRGGQQFLTCSKRGTIAIWDAATAKLIRTLQRKLDSETALMPEFYHVAISPNGQWIITLGFGVVIVWDANTGRKIRSEQLAVKAVAVFPDGQRFLAGGNDGIAAVWDIESGEKSLAVQLDDGVCAVAVFPDGRWFLTACLDGTSVVWDGSGNNIRTVRSEGFVLAVAVFPGSQQFLTSHYESKRVFVWDIKTGNMIQNVPHDDDVRAIAVFPGGQKFVTTSGKFATVWGKE